MQGEAIMKRWISILIALLVLGGHEGILRLHVIAHSNSAADQAIKLTVRDGILAY